MERPDHRHENALLRAAARLTPDTARPPAPALDWPYLLRAAEWQGIMPLLHTSLHTTGLPVPPEVTAHLHAAYWQHHFRNRALMAELADLLRAAAAARIDAMPLKGAVLAPLYYPTAALRPLSDLDFMVRPDDAERFAAILRDRGYRHALARPALPQPHVAQLLREWTFVRQTPATTLIVEFRIEPLDPALGTLLACDSALVTRLMRHADGIWARARRDEFAGAPLWRIAPEDLLLHVASHLTTRHTGYRLLWLHDLCRITAAHPGDLDWPQVAANARALRLHAPVFTALEAACDWLDAPIPLAMITPRFFGTTERGLSMARVERRLLTARRGAQTEADLSREPPLQWWLLAASLLRLRGVRPYLRALRWTLVPGRAYMAAWRSRPEETGLRGYLSSLLLRIALGAAAVIAPLSRRARIPGLPTWCDRLLRRVRPFAIYRPDDEPDTR